MATATGQLDSSRAALKNGPMNWLGLGRVVLCPRWMCMWFRLISSVVVVATATAAAASAASSARGAVVECWRC